MDDDEFFVPVLVDTSDFRDAELQQTTSHETYDEFYWRRKAETAANAPYVEDRDITVESLLDLPLTSRSLMLSDLDSNQHRLIDGLHAMHDRIHRSERNELNSRVRLKNATETYTKLLERFPNKKEIFLAEYDSSENVDLLDDKAIQPIYERLYSRLALLEARRHLENENARNDFQRLMHNQQQSNSGTLSDIEKARGGAGAESFEKYKDLFELDAVPALHSSRFAKPSSVINTNQQDELRNHVQKESDSFFKRPVLPLDQISNKSSGSSRSLKIDDAQRHRLNSFAEKLRSGEILPAASSSPKIQRHVSVLNKSAQCEVCRLDKSTQCRCSEPSMHDKWTKTSFLYDRPSRDIDTDVPDNHKTEKTIVNDRLNYDELKAQLFALKNKAKEHNLLKQKEHGENEMNKRPSSAPLSPVRKQIKWNIDEKKPAFVAGKSSVTSYSVTVNLQELLAVLKRQNPALHQICLKMGSHVSLVTLAEAFEKGLKLLSRQAHVNLIQKLKQFEELNQEIRSLYDPTQKENLEQKQQGLVTEIEQLDTYIQRLNVQSNTLVKLKKTVETEMACKNRMCKAYAPRMGRSVSPPSNIHAYSNNITQHTVSSKQKTLPAILKPKPASFVNNKISAQFLKDLKTAKIILGNS